jgi:hypothetical protein
MPRWLALLAVIAGVGCGGRSIKVNAMDGGNVDGAPGADERPDGNDQGAELPGRFPVPPGCENVQFSGRFFTGYPQEMSFDEALQVALRQQQLGYPIDLQISDPSSTDGLECFDGLIKGSMSFTDCSGPFRITRLPKGTKELRVDESCPVIDISGVAGVPRVTIDDASANTDFSPLLGATYVQMLSKAVRLDAIAPYVLGASVLLLTVEATSLAPLNDASAQYLWINGQGLHSVADFTPPPTLFCFGIILDPTASAEEQAAVAQALCSSSRQGPDCPDYRNSCCWNAQGMFLDCGSL